MTDGAALVLLAVGAVGSGVVAGVFFAFSTFVMPALRRLPDARGMAAMQSINVTAVTPPFMLALFGTAIVCVAVAVIAIVNWGEDGATAAFVGSVVYVLSVVVVTAVYHVPRNDALARLDADAPSSAPAWARFLREWTGMNHVRTLGALASTICFVVALPS
jgi:uncharacterized membrane protein